MRDHIEVLRGLVEAVKALPYEPNPYTYRQKQAELVNLAVASDAALAALSAQAEAPLRCVACGLVTDAPCGGLDGNGLGCTNKQDAQPEAQAGGKAGLGVEELAEWMFNNQKDKLAAPWSRQWGPTKAYWIGRAAERLAAPPPGAVPEGWKLVPVEPTPEMLSLALSHVYGAPFWRADAKPLGAFYPGHTANESEQVNIAECGPERVRAAFAAMLAAAPVPPEEKK